MRIHLHALPTATGKCCVAISEHSLNRFRNPSIHGKETQKTKVTEFRGPVSAQSGLVNGLVRQDSQVCGLVAVPSVSECRDQLLERK